MSGKNTNPWANLPGSAKASNTQASTQNAVALAQAERAKRAQDRDRLNAAKRLQKVWRGHSSRKLQRQKWRDQWDKREQARPEAHGRPPYDARSVESTALAYSNEDELEYQMRLLLQFLDVHDAMDRWRLCHFGKDLAASWGLIEGTAHTMAWNQSFTKLSRIVSKAIALSEDHLQITLLLRLGLLALQKPIRLDFDSQFANLGRLSKELAPALTSEYIQALLLRKDHQSPDAFVGQILSTSNVAVLPDFLHFVAIKRNQIMLCESIRRVVQDLPVESSLYVLANTIHIWRSLSNDDKLVDWISAISVALARCANIISARVDEVDQPMSGTPSNSSQAALDPFVKSEIVLLPLQESVQYVMSQFRGAGSSVAEVAKPLANYAVALLRAFPSKATNIRMWLYRNSPTVSGSGSSSTIQYLWRAARATTVFRSIRSGQKEVLSTLIEAKPVSNQFNYQPASREEVLAWQEEWRILLLFLELYTFILKLMDDEEFFSLDEPIPEKAPSTYQFRHGALPLSEIADLGSFLKNLAFALYWHAADLAEYNEVEDVATISAIFGGNPTSAPIPKGTAKTLAGNDVSQTYMKGLATGLLRMLHERDSRRKFLPNNYWLMTNHFDLQGFIPAVVAEEERRHELIEDDEDDDSPELDEQSKIESDELQLPSLGSLFNIRAPHTPRSQSSKQAEVLAKQRELARKRRHLQSLNPRLEILRNLPFFIPFDTRVQIFRRFVYRDQERRRHGFVDPDDWRMSVAASQARGLHGRGMDTMARHHASIHRGMVFEDAFESFYGLGEDLKEPIQISFIDQFGQPEAGIDGGGVTKEFLMSVTSEAFDPRSEMPMFEENEQRYIYPKPTTIQQARHMLIEDGNEAGTEGFNAAIRGILQHYEFLGRIVGKCMYEGILIDVNFAGFFLLKWALTGGTTTATTESAYRASINDLRDFDDQLYQGLLGLKNYTGDVEADFGLNFTVTDTFEVDGRTVSATNDLIPGGSKKLVNNSNRLLYIDRMVRYRLQEQPRQMTNYFLKGLGQIISPMWLAMFNQKELQKLVGGDNNELDILDLRRNTQYGGLYVIGDDGLEHPTVAMFWKVLKEMNDADRRAVLKFVTSTPRAPLLGFSHLNPKFSIRDSSEDQTRLPSTSTCVNLLKLPRYVDERTMREKLLYAANAGAGFDLS